MTRRSAIFHLGHSNRAALCGLIAGVLVLGGCGGGAAGPAPSPTPNLTATAISEAATAVAFTDSVASRLARLGPDGVKRLLAQRPIPGALLPDGVTASTVNLQDIAVDEVLNAGALANSQQLQAMGMTVQVNGTWDVGIHYRVYGSAPEAAQVFQEDSGSIWLGASRRLDGRHPGFVSAPSSFGGGPITSATAERQVGNVLVSASTNDTEDSFGAHPNMSATNLATSLVEAGVAHLERTVLGIGPGTPTPGE